MVGAWGGSGRNQQRRVGGTAPARLPHRTLPATVTRSGQGGGLVRKGGPSGVNTVAEGN